MGLEWLHEPEDSSQCLGEADAFVSVGILLFNKHFLSFYTMPDIVGCWGHMIRLLSFLEEIIFQWGRQMSEHGSQTLRFRKSFETPWSGEVLWLLLKIEKPKKKRLYIQLHYKKYSAC